MLYEVITAIATVDEFGIVTATGIGSATITATTADGAKKATCAVTATAFVATKVTGLSIAEGSATNLQFYVTKKLNATILPANATVQTVVWSTADASITSYNVCYTKLLRFMDATGANMDFHSIHIYDWPKWEAVSNSIRAGGHTEAMLDMIEWYDNYKFGTKKEVVISEYGAVSAYIDKPGLDPKRRDWENLKPFNSMLMQFLERPSQVVLSMPFTPIKAEWGDYLNADSYNFV